MVQAIFKFFASKPIQIILVGALLMWIVGHGTKVSGVISKNPELVQVGETTFGAGTGLILLGVVLFVLYFRKRLGFWIKKVDKIII